METGDPGFQVQLPCVGRAVGVIAERRRNRAAARLGEGSGGDGGSEDGRERGCAARASQLLQETGGRGGWSAGSEGAGGTRQGPRGGRSARTRGLGVWVVVLSVMAARARASNK